MKFTEMLILFVVLTVLISVQSTINYGNKTTTREKIVNVDIIIKNSSYGYGIERIKHIFTENNVYTTEDRILIGQNNSMDLYNIAKQNIGKQCDITTIGSRIGLISNYKNVTKINNCNN